ncbi:inositol-tetrakisphosphate 1-kinase [Paraphysoderma sedebokerense]|nr:inositol-tetrakisphosphate 1-kinase [Paraphysoderma sedebokerense]
MSKTADTASKHRVGFIFPAKKLAKAGFSSFAEFVAPYGIEFVNLDITRPLHDQGQIDLLLHKLTETILAADNGDANANKHLENVSVFMKANPKIPVIDPISNLRTLLNRDATFELLSKVANISSSSKEQLFHLPKSVIYACAHKVPIETDRANNETVTFPVIIKRSEACSSQSSHEMVLVRSKSEFSAVLKNDVVSLKQGELKFVFGKDDEVMVQKFVNHDGVLFKVYVLDSFVHVLLRPSLKNVNVKEYTESTSPLYFDSQTIPKSFPADLSQTTEVMSDPVAKAFLSATPEIRAKVERYMDMKLINDIATGIREKLGITLFGFDLIREVETGRWFVVDLNYFPSFEGMPKFQENLLKTLLKRLD